MKELLDKAVEVVRSRFGGKLSYASLPFEGVNLGAVRHHLDGRRLSDRARSPRASATTSARLPARAGRRGNQWQLPSSGALRTAMQAIWPTVTIQ
jgi:hypothetical protein